MPQGVDLRPISSAAHERIIRGHGSIVAHAKNFASQAVWLLRHPPDIPAGSHVEHSVAPERDAAAEPSVALPGIANQNIAHFREYAALQPSASNRGRAFIVFNRLVVGEVKQMIFGELGM